MVSTRADRRHEKLTRMAGTSGVKVREAMTGRVMTIAPERSLREAAQFMTKHKIGAAVITDPDLVRALANGGDPDRDRVCDHLTSRATFADGDWSLEEAADAMAEGGFRHLVVIEAGEVTGIISMRDIIAVWRPDKS